MGYDPRAQAATPGRGMVTVQRVLRALAKGLDVAADELESDVGAPVRALPAGDTSANPPKSAHFPDVSAPSPPSPRYGPVPVVPPEALGPPPAPAAPPPPPRQAPVAAAPVPPTQRQRAREDGAAAYRAGTQKDQNPHKGLYGISGARRCGWDEGWEYGRRVMAAAATDEGVRAAGRRARAENVERFANPNKAGAPRDLWWEGWDEENDCLVPPPVPAAVS